MSLAGAQQLPGPSRDPTFGNPEEDLADSESAWESETFCCLMEDFEHAIWAYKNDIFHPNLEQNEHYL
jgi:hypothetical protein